MPLKSIFGSKVKVPKFIKVDPDEQVKKAFKSMQKQLPEGAAIAKDIGKADADTALAVLERFAPGTGKVIAQQMENIQAGLAGEVPTDVQNLVQNRAAARSFAGGFGGSEAARNLELRDLGLTSLQRMDTAMAQANQTLGLFKSMTPAQQSVGSMFMTPQQRLAHAVNERNTKFQRDFAQAQEKAKPNPIAKGLFDAAVTIGGGALGSFIGGKSLGTTLSAAKGAPSVGQAGSGFMGPPSNYQNNYSPYVSNY